MPTGRGACYAELVEYPSVSHNYEVRLGKGSVKWIVPEPWQNPQQFHIIKAIAELPVLSTGIGVYAYRDSEIKVSEAINLKRYV